MKIKKIFIGFILTFIFISCSNNTQTSVLQTQNQTLRNQIKEKESNVKWTNEIEGEILETKIINHQRINSKVTITPQVLNSITDLQKAVFPEIRNFESLDCSLAPANLIEFINTFINTFFTNQNEIQKFFDDSYIFNYVFFMNDLKELNIDEKQKFDNFYICKPFISEENIQVPVRIYNQDLYIKHFAIWVMLVAMNLFNL